MARTAERYTTVQQPLSEGKSLAAIGRRLRLDHSTVRRFARAQSLDELVAKATNRTSIVDEHKPCPHRRWREGCYDIPQLHRELCARGFTGDIQCVRRYFRRDFADMMRDLRGEELPAWMDRVLSDDLPALHSLVNGMNRNLDAVTAGLSAPWSSGQVEGQVTRVKLLKRMGYGRANLDLLRRRVLSSP
ncbi:transposase [Streptomyces sp. NPDC093261]|uniref:transposase n=1 Tax=Streptomyces sp. NPDC093261 TaxID=3366037 RepID=UPI00380EF719